MKIAVYEKGGIGKSMTSYNISVALSRHGNKVLQIGCDPKHDSTFTLTGFLIPTIIDTLQIKHYHYEDIWYEDVIHKGYGGNIPGQKYKEIVFPILSPDPSLKKELHFWKYPIYAGGNRGRGQVYPDGSQSNNTIFNASLTGRISKILRKEKGGYEVLIENILQGRSGVDIIPPGPELLVSEGDFVKADQPLTNNPNMGGFGQVNAEIVLQDPFHIQGLLFFLTSVVLAQIFLVLKKKQFEKVQLSEMNF